MGQLWKMKLNKKNQTYIFTDIDIYGWADHTGGFEAKNSSFPHLAFFS